MVEAVQRLSSVACFATQSCEPMPVLLEVGGVALPWQRWRMRGAAGGAGSGAFFLALRWRSLLESGAICTRSAGQPGMPQVGLDKAGQRRFHSPAFDHEWIIFRAYPSPSAWGWNTQTAVDYDWFKWSGQSRCSWPVPCSYTGTRHKLMVQTNSYRKM